MGAFVLGILVGWLAEWLFFTFWVKGGSSSDSSECEELRSALAEKNREISALKSASVSDMTKSKAEAASSPASVSSAKPAVKKKPAVTKKDTSAKKTPAKKTATKKPAAKKPAVKKAPAKKAAPRKIAAKKTPAKKAAPKKTATSGKAADDLTKLSGIGPSMSVTLGELGIDTYKKLAAMDDDILRDMLEASGARLNNNKEAMDSWNEQALLAGKGDFAGLKKLQEELKG